LAAAGPVAVVLVAGGLVSEGSVSVDFVSVDLVSVDSVAADLADWSMVFADVAVAADVVAAIAGDSGGGP
jgi:hypothetical protein